MANNTEGVTDTIPSDTRAVGAVVSDDSELESSPFDQADGFRGSDDSELESSPFDQADGFR